MKVRAASQALGASPRPLSDASSHPCGRWESFERHPSIGPAEEDALSAYRLNYICKSGMSHRPRDVPKRLSCETHVRGDDQPYCDLSWCQRSKGHGKSEMEQSEGLKDVALASATAAHGIDYSARFFWYHKVVRAEERVSQSVLAARERPPIESYPGHDGLCWRELYP